SDIVIQRNNEIYVIKFKLAKDETQIQKKIREGWSQIREKGYAEGYKDSGRFIAETVIVVDDKNKVASISTSDEI
ncbi:MAG: PD-(D/E)XK nuclease domain-containing protein, partial [Desulfovibrio sp.]|nr:PD-(D/E)XK nuclease domain-containing protein [Desulfovibrio sp.]